MEVFLRKSAAKAGLQPIMTAVDVSNGLYYRGKVDLPIEHSITAHSASHELLGVVLLFAFTPI